MKKYKVLLVLLGIHVGVMVCADTKRQEQYEMLLISGQPHGGEQDDTFFCDDSHKGLKKCAKQLESASDSTGCLSCFSPNFFAVACKIGLRVFCCVSWDATARYEKYETCDQVRGDCAHALDNMLCGKMLNVCCS